MSSLLYQHLPLDPSRKQVRLVKLLPRTYARPPSTKDDRHPGYSPDTSEAFNDIQDVIREKYHWVQGLHYVEDNPAPLQLSIDAVSLLENPGFTALSYVWGTGASRSRVTINSREEQFSMLIAENLASALHGLQPEPNETPLTIWIDAICIDQSSTAEKDSQVPFMRHIYKAATEVFVSLGPERPDTGVAFLALELLGRHRMRVLQDHERGVLEGGIFDFELEFLADSIPLQSAGGSRKLRVTPFCDTISTFLELPWWSRVWVVQELALARKATFIFGNIRLDSDLLLAGIFATNRMEGLVEKLINSEHKTLGKKLAYNGIENSVLLPENMAPITNMFLMRSRFRIKETSGEAHLIVDILLDSYSTRNRIQPGLCATHAKDRIYGLLGLASDVGILGIVPTYKSTVSVEEVYIDTARRILTHGGLNLLLMVGKHHTALPSWVPDWRNSMRRTPNYPSRMQKCGLYSASGKLPLVSPWVHCSNPRLMNFAGWAVDTVAATGAALSVEATTPVNYLDHPETLHLVEQASDAQRERLKTYAFVVRCSVMVDRIKRFLTDLQRSCEWARKTEIYSSKDDFPDPVALSLLISVAGQELVLADDKQRGIRQRMKFSEDTTRWARSVMAVVAGMSACLREPNFETEMWDMFREAPGEPNKLLDEFNAYVALLKFCVGWKPFITHRGYIGLGPSDMVKGDIICIFQGGQCPYVLHIEGDRRYSLVGDCYTYGIMDGEFLRDERKTETFQIV